MEDVKLDQNISGVENFDGTLKSPHHLGAFIGTDIDFLKCGNLGKIPLVKDLSTHFEVSTFDKAACTGGFKYTYRF